jgi:hypothetical protein
VAKCPHCDKNVSLSETHREASDLPDSVHKDVVGLIKKEIMYSCPHCNSVLGFGFFLGGIASGRP